MKLPWRQEPGKTGLTKRISGVNNSLEHAEAILTDVHVEIRGNGNAIRIGRGSRLNGTTIRLTGDGHQVSIGEDCVLNEGCSLWFEDSGGQLVIGDKSTFEGTVHIAITEPGSRVTIGSDCMFAYDIDVRTGDSHAILSSTSGTRLNPAADVFVGEHVWVAAHAMLLKGVHVESNSVVAAGSVVTRKFETGGVVIAGNPADVVKRDVTWSRDRMPRQ